MNRSAGQRRYKPFEIWLSAHRHHIRALYPQWISNQVTAYGLKVWAKLRNCDRRFWEDEAQRRRRNAIEVARQNAPHEEVNVQVELGALAYAQAMEDIMSVEYIVNNVTVAPVGVIDSSGHDALIVITVPGTSPPHELENIIAAATEIDKGLEKMNRSAGQRRYKPFEIWLSAHRHHIRALYPQWISNQVTAYGLKVWAKLRNCDRRFWEDEAQRRRRNAIEVARQNAPHEEVNVQVELGALAYAQAMEDIMSVEYIVNNVTVAPVGVIDSSGHDALIVITVPGTSPPHELENIIAAATEIDKGLEKIPGVLYCSQVPGNRLVLSPTGPISPYDDVRLVYEAALAGMRRACDAGATRPVLALPVRAPWPRAALVALLGALEALYVPIQIRETFPEKRLAVRALGVYGEGTGSLPAIVRDACALEQARGVSRDIGGADPERMTPLGVAAYVRAAFGPTVRVRVEEDTDVLAANYPLFAAVNRAANQVPRHKGCVIHLDYEPDSCEETVMLVGKGVTYDTGGCDIEAGGVMAGMSRDKCGAAAVAGFLKACELLKPRLRVSAALCMVRNSVCSEAYVADELIKCRRGLAVRVGNTDAEGRMVMADVLTEMAEKARTARKPHLYTVATLTGHAKLAVGSGYSIIKDNHAARAKHHAEAFRAAGQTIADMVKVSTIQREDLTFHRGQCPGDDVHQAGNLVSSQTSRGHQGPAGFLLLVSGLDSGQLPYSHLDVAASAGSLPAPPTAAPLLALAAHYKLIAD